MTDTKEQKIFRAANISAVWIAALLAAMLASFTVLFLYQRYEAHKIFKAARTVCEQQNVAREASNDANQAISRFISVYENTLIKRILHQSPAQQKISEQAIGQYRQLRESLRVVPVLNCNEITKETLP